MTMYADDPLHMPVRAGFFSGLHEMKSPLRWFRRRYRREPGSTLAGSAAFLLGSYVVLNALFMQTERHPAPIFTSLIEERVTASDTPLPPVRPQALDRRYEATTTATATRAAQSAQAEPREAPVNQKDQMAALIRNGGAPSMHADAADRTRTLAAMQRALNRAGYGPVREDGVMGPGTRGALERFEKDRRLPVKGEPQGRVLRELAQVSGVAIE